MAPKAIHRAPAPAWSFLHSANDGTSQGTQEGESMSAYPATNEGFSQYLAYDRLEISSPATPLSCVSAPPILYEPFTYFDSPPAGTQYLSPVISQASHFPHPYPIMHPSHPIQPEYQALAGVTPPSAALTFSSVLSRSSSLDLQAEPYASPSLSSAGSWDVNQHMLLPGYHYAPGALSPSYSSFHHHHQGQDSRSFAVKVEDDQYEDYSHGICPSQGRSQDESESSKGHSIDPGMEFSVFARV
jgi:hypothetical protein